MAVTKYLDPSLPAGLTSPGWFSSIDHDARLIQARRNPPRNTGYGFWLKIAEPTKNRE